MRWTSRSTEAPGGGGGTAHYTPFRGPRDGFGAPCGGAGWQQWCLTLEFPALCDGICADLLRFVRRREHYAHAGRA